MIASRQMKSKIKTEVGAESLSTMDAVSSPPAERNCSENTIIGPEVGSQQQHVQQLNQQQQLQQQGQKQKERQEQQKSQSEQQINQQKDVQQEYAQQQQNALQRDELQQQDVLQQQDTPQQQYTRQQQDTPQQDLLYQQQYMQEQQYMQHQQYMQQQHFMQQQQKQQPWHGTPNENNWNTNFNGNNWQGTDQRPSHCFQGPQGFGPNTPNWLLNNNNYNRPNYRGNFGPPDYNNQNNTNRNNFIGPNFGTESNNNNNCNNFAGPNFTNNFPALSSNNNNCNNWSNSEPNLLPSNIQNTGELSRSQRKKLLKARKRYAKFLRKQENSLNQDECNQNEVQFRTNDLRNSSPANAQRSEENLTFQENSRRDRNREHPYSRERPYSREYPYSREHSYNRERQYSGEHSQSRGKPQKETNAGKHQVENQNRHRNCEESIERHKNSKDTSTCTSTSISIRKPKPSSTAEPTIETNKPTPKKATDSCDTPRIQIRPLTQLLKQEIFAVTQEDRLAKQPKGAAENTSKTPFKPTVQLRTRTASHSSANGGELSINERLAHMNKEDLKYIINNSDTIYDEPLKQQARKRLREEIRRQLKNIQIEQSKDQKKSSELVEDEIVDAIKLPKLLLQEIQKAFCLDLGVKQEIEQIDTNEETSEPNKNLVEIMPAIVKSEKDPMSRIKVTEELKSTARKRSGDPIAPLSEHSNKLVKKSHQQIPAKTPSKEAEHKVTPKGASKAAEVSTLKQQSMEKIPANIVIKKEASPVPQITEDISTVVLLSSDEENESGDESAARRHNVNDAHDSDGSTNSTASAKRRSMQKLKIDTDNVVNSFKKLILPHLGTQLAASYRRNHSRNMNSRLNFISCVVTSPEYNSQHFDKAEIAKIQMNLKQQNNRFGIEFLLREISNVVNFIKQPVRRKQQSQQRTVNEITAEPLVNDVKNADPAAVVQSEAAKHQTTVAKPAAAAAAPVKSPGAPNTPANTPPYSEALTVGVFPHAMSMTTTAVPRNAPMLQYALNLDPTLSRISPGNYPVPGNIDFSDGHCQENFNDTIARNLMEIDRRILENHNRRTFLEEMILKFQKEKSDLELLGMELQNRKFLLLNTAFQRNQMGQGNFVPPPIGVQTPTNTPPPQPSPPARNKAELSNVSKVRRPARRTLIIKRVKVSTKQEMRPKRRKIVINKTKSAKNPKNVVTQDAEQSVTMPSPLLVTKIKEEPKEANEPQTQLKSGDAGSKPAPSSTNLEPSKPKCLRLTTSQPLAIIPPLPPPPPPPESIADHMTYDLPRILLKAPSPNSTSSSDYNKKSSAVDIKPYNNTRHLSNGRLHNIRSPITQLRIYKSSIIAAAEDGDIYMFHIQSHRLERQITKHSEAITNMFLCEENSFLYTTSLDGFLKKSSLENLEGVLQTIYLKEPLQSIDVAWNMAFIGSRWGSLFTFNVLTHKVIDMPLVIAGHSIIAIKAHEAGDRKLIILGCKGNTIYIHDAITGIVMRELGLPKGLNVYSMLLNDGYIFCGTQKNQIFKFKFATGQLVSTIHCGNGAVSMSSYKDRYLLAGCYDGFIYVLDKIKSEQMGRFEGSGRLVLALAISDDKVITSSKDNSLEVTDIPMDLLDEAPNAH